MKQKTHSGLKKRVRQRGSGTMMMQKSCKNHRLSGKSKRQKKLFLHGMGIDPTNLNKIQKLLPH